MNESLVQGRRHHLFRVGGGGLDEVAQHVVVFDLQRGDPGLGGILRLHGGDHATALVAQLAGLVERFVIAGSDEAAVAGKQRRLGHQRGIEPREQVLVAAQRIARGGEKRGQGGLVECLRDLLGLGQRVAHRGEVARTAAVEPEARQGAVEVGDLAQQIAQRAGEGRLDAPVERVETVGDHRELARRRRDPTLEQARAPRRHGAVDHREQRALPATIHRLGQFEVAAGGGGDLQQARDRVALRRAQQGQAAFLGDVEIVDQRTHRRQLGAFEAAEARQGLHAEQGAEPCLGPGAVEGGAAQHGGVDAEIAQHRAQLVLGGLGDQKLGRRKPRQLGADAGLTERHHVERPGRDIGPGQRPCVSNLAQSGKKVVPPGLEQGLLGERAGGDEPHHLALDHRFRAALLGLGGAFHLFADRDAKALADQRQKVALGGMDRHAAHRDIVAGVLAALGQRDVERLGGGGGIVEEQLVEIAHAIEQQRVGVPCLDLEILCHHWRDCRHIVPR